MKKLFTLCLALLLALALPVVAFASSGEASGEAASAVSLTVGDWSFTRTGSDGTYTVTITQFSGDPDENGVVIVPAVLGGGTVTAVGMTAFRNTEITAILLPETVETVSQWAFYDCTSLAYVTCANGGVEIDEAAFQNSPGLVLSIGTELTLEAGTDDLTGFSLLVSGTYILPDGYAEPALEAGVNGILRDDAAGALTVAENRWVLTGYDTSGVDLASDLQAELVVDEALVETYGLTAAEINMTFRAVSAEEAEELNEEILAGSFADYASRLTYQEGFYLGGGLVDVDENLVCYDAATGEIIAQGTDILDNPILDALGVKDSQSPYTYVAWRDTDEDGDIDVLFYGNRALAADSATVTLTGELVKEGVSGTNYSEDLAGKVGRPLLDEAYISFENACVEAGAGETVTLDAAELETADGTVLGKINEERSLVWASEGGVVEIACLIGVSTSEGNWTKLRNENNSYTGQPMEAIMQWGIGAALYASEGGIISIGDPEGERSSVYACGDGANGVLATGVLDESQPSQIYVYNTDFILEGWNNHVVDTIYGGYVYLEDVYGETGKAGSYIMNNGSTLANDFGDGTVEISAFTGIAWGDSSAGAYLIGGGSLRGEDSSLTSHLNAAIKALGGSRILTNTDLTGMNAYSGSGTAEFDGGTWTLIRDYEGDGYVYGAAAAEIAQLWYDITGGTTLLSYVMSGVGNTYTELYAEYQEEIDAWGGKEAFYQAVNAIADEYGYGEDYYASDDALLRSSMFDNTYYAIMRNGFQYSPTDGVYSLEQLADWSDVPYLGASNLSSFQVSFLDVSGELSASNITFVYDDSIGEDYRYLSTGSGTVNLTDCTGASGIVTDGTITFARTDFEGSFAAGSSGLWDGEIGYIDGTGEYTYRNGNYNNEDAAGATAVFEDCTWTVTHDSYLASLTIGETAQVVGADGAAVTLYVDGVETDLQPGTYEGDVQVLLG
ncbi:MAG: leucine-rich repeat domain-containing protein [Oscillospiraceae bacterium]|nr:leucine-rich repeat domain-containing protein [Oscillospiraceae bacterium]